MITPFFTGWLVAFPTNLLLQQIVDLIVIASNFDTGAWRL